MSATLLLFALLSLHVVDPVYPPRVVIGGTVVAELHFEAGKVKSLRILSGEEPFSSSASGALKEWRSDSEQDSDELVVVHFRQPYLYNVNSDREEIRPQKPKSALPYPKIVISPAYPANALGQGSVVLRLKISAEGRVIDVETIRSVGGVTEPSLEAVRKWEFTAPKNDKGVNQASYAYAVFVYRFPVLTR